MDDMSCPPSCPTQLKLARLQHARNLKTRLGLCSARPTSSPVGFRRASQIAAPRPSEGLCCDATDPPTFSQHLARLQRLVSFGRLHSKWIWGVASKCP
jgi:hypothetical protein